MHNRNSQPADEFSASVDLRTGLFAALTEFTGSEVPRPEPQEPPDAIAAFCAAFDDTVTGELAS